MKNWKTSVFGVGASVAAALSQVPAFTDYKGLLEGMATVLGALFALSAKDHNVTGGKVQQ
jgi:hypothetical protein